MDFNENDIYFNNRNSPCLTLILGTETSQLVVAVGGKVQTKPVLAANDGRGKVGASEPEQTERRATLN